MAKKVLNIGDLPDIDIAARMRITNYEKFKSLVRMHLSFELDLNTDEFDLPCHEIVYEDKGKLKKWNRLSKKQKSANSSGCAVYAKGSASAGNSPTENLQQQIDPGFLFHLQELKEFLLQEKNVTQEGLFRKTGSVSRQNELRLKIQNNEALDLAGGGFSAHDCATVFKGYLAELPEPLLTDAHYPAHLQIAPLCLGTSLVPKADTSSSSSSSVSKKPQNPERLKREQHLLNSMQLLLLLLPPENRQLLQDIIDMLHKVAVHSEKNKMTAENLATLFAPHLICPRNLPPEALHYVAKKMSSIIAYMIQKGSSVFEVPAKLSTDIRAYFLERKRKKTMSPEHTLDESISDISTVNTVYTFLDREKTAAAHTSNNTDTALAQLYAHIQSLPESSKKRRLIKQFNKQNGQGTPLQFVVMNRLKNSEATRSAKSIGDSIKKHIFHKSIMSRTPKHLNQPMPTLGNETPNFSTGKNHKQRVLFQSPAPTPLRVSRSAADSFSSGSRSNTPTSTVMHLNSMSPSNPLQTPPASNTSNLPSFITKTHSLQKSISSSSLLTRASYDVDELRMETVLKSASSSSSSSSSSATSCAASLCSSDDFLLQSTSKLTASAPVSRQTSTDLNAAAIKSTSSSSLPNAAHHFDILEPIQCVTPLKIISEAAKQLAGVGRGIEKKSVAWDGNQLFDIKEISNPCTPIKQIRTARELNARYKSEPDLSLLLQDKNGDGAIDGQTQITPIYKNKSLTQLIKGVSMGNLKFPFATPESNTGRLANQASIGFCPSTSAAESDAINMDDDTFGNEASKDLVADVDDQHGDVLRDDDDDDGDCDGVVRVADEIIVIGDGVGGACSSSSSSELPGASSTSYRNLLHNSSVYRKMDLITSTPSMLLGRRSMSPITKSTQRMPKAMQESIMTPRSRKPVMVLNTALLGGSSDPNLTIGAADLSNFREQDEEDSLAGSPLAATIATDDFAQVQSTLPLNIDEDALDGYSEIHVNSSKATDDVADALTNNFKEYLLRRSVLTASPVDSSFSSQPGDFVTPNDGDDLDSSLTPSLIYCLDGNQPQDQLASVIAADSHNDEAAADMATAKKGSSSITRNSRFNRLSNNPFIIINNARKRAATNDLEKLSQHNSSSCNSTAGNVFNSSASTSSTSSLSPSSATSTQTNAATANVENIANKENYEHSQGYLLTKKLLISEYPGETSF